MKDVSVSFVATALIQVINIATGLLAARLLLPEGRGQLAEIMLWAGLIVEFGIVGLSDALLYRAATGAASPRQLFAATAALSGIFSVVLIAAGFIIEPYAFTGKDPYLLHLALVFLVAYVPVYLGALMVASIFQGHLDMMTWNLLRCIVALGYLLLIGVAALSGHATVEGFAAAYVLSMVAALIVGLVLAARKHWIAWQPDWPTLKGIVIYGAKVHVGEMLNSARQKIDQALVALWLPHADLGLYVVALTVANGPLILAQTLANLAFPKIAQQTEIAGKIVVFGRYFRFTLAVTVAAAVVLLALNPFLVPLLFGQPFAPAALIANIMLIGLPAAAAKLMFIQALKSWDRSLVIGHAELVGLIAAAIALFSLLPSFGIAGAAASLVIANLVAAGAMVVSMRRHLGLSLAILFTPTADDWRLVRDLMKNFRR
jgi:O-antigen/teichoic acid export membrane protein